MRDKAPSERMLTPREVADRAGVHPKTVARWAESGRLPYARTLGGHRRFRESDVEAAFPQLGGQRT